MSSRELISRSCATKKSCTIPEIGTYSRRLLSLKRSSRFGVPRFAEKLVWISVRTGKIDTLFPTHCELLATSTDRMPVQAVIGSINLVRSAKKSPHQATSRLKTLSAPFGPVLMSETRKMRFSYLLYRTGGQKIR